MELNAESIGILGFISVDTQDMGYCARSQFSEAGRKVCAHLLQVGYIGFNFEHNGYYINDNGKGLLERLVTPAGADDPPDETAALKASITRLEGELAAAKERLAAHERAKDMKGARVWNQTP